MPFKDINLEKINNNTYYIELTEKTNKLIYDYLEIYGNISINKNSENSLIININEYNRKPSNYDEQGKIITYNYKINMDFITNSKGKSINVNKNIDAAIEQSIAQDSLVIEGIRNYLDFIREDF